MFNAWFVPYHTYTRRAWHDADALDRFARDCRWARRNRIRLLILSEYHRNYPEYLSFWSWKTLHELLKIAHGHGMKVLPYASPTGIDVSSDFYRFHGDECCVKVRSKFGTLAKSWGWRSLPDGGPYWENYRGTHCVWVNADPSTGWKNYYLESCEGLLDFGFDGIYIDQHQQSTESADHPDINLHMMDMLEKMRAMVKAANPDNLICANVMAAPPKADEQGREFLRRTRIADYGLTESTDRDITKGLESWIDRTDLTFFLLSHGPYESHQRKIEVAAKLGQPLCLLLGTPLDVADPRILRLYES